MTRFRFIACEKCRYTWITFDPKREGNNGRLVPIEHRTGLIHDCSFNYPYYCHCGKLIYTDQKVLSPTGKMIPLDYDLDTYHYCDKQGSSGEVQFLKKSGLED
jgi:hypothetical protein